MPLSTNKYNYTYARIYAAISELMANHGDEFKKFSDKTKKLDEEFQKISVPSIQVYLPVEGQWKTINKNKFNINSFSKQDQTITLYQSYSDTLAEFPPEKLTAEEQIKKRNELVEFLAKLNTYTVPTDYVKTHSIASDRDLRINKYGEKRFSLLQKEQNALQEHTTQLFQKYNLNVSVLKSLSIHTARAAFTEKFKSEHPRSTISNWSISKAGWGGIIGSAATIVAIFGIAFATAGAVPFFGVGAIPGFFMGIGFGLAFVAVVIGLVAAAWGICRLIDAIKNTLLEKQCEKEFQIEFEKINDNIPNAIPEKAINQSLKILSKLSDTSDDEEDVSTLPLPATDDAASYSMPPLSRRLHDTHASSLQLPEALSVAHINAKENTSLTATI